MDYKLSAQKRVIQIQEEILQFLALSTEGDYRVRTLMKDLHPERYGASWWHEAYQGLIKSGTIEETGRGTKNSPRMVSLVIPALPAITKTVEDQLSVAMSLLSAHLAVVLAQYLKTL